MRSITIKLTLAFLFVSMIGAALAGFFIQQRTRNEFSSFLFAQEKNQLVDSLIQYYQNYGSWDGVEQIMHNFVFGRHLGVNAEPPHTNEAPDLPPFRTPFTLAGADNIIIFSNPERIGLPLSQEEIDTAMPLDVDGVTVGWLIAWRLESNWSVRPIEGAFLNNVNRAIITSTLIAVIIALLLGGILARTLTHPIHELTKATQAVADGNLGYQVDVKTKDELGKLADSFNQMSVELAQENKIRVQMTADIAHDLRTPLSLILGYTEALSDGKLEATPEIFSVMNKEAGHLSHLIDDLRTISLADSGKLPLNLQPVQPRTILQRTASALSLQAQQKGVSLDVKADDLLPLVEVDIERMAQVLSNLVSNAIRHTQVGGEVALSADYDQNSVYLRVQDNGEGIAPEDLPFIFNRFYRGDKSRQNNGEAGLGLTIAKSIVDAHGGTISAQNLPSQGAAFVIRLPCLLT